MKKLILEDLEVLELPEDEEKRGNERVVVARLDDAIFFFNDDTKQKLEDKLEGVKNYHIAVKEKGEDVIFLRKIVEGGTDESYGIHVAKLAGVPRTVVAKATKILRSLERGGIKVKEELVKGVSTTMDISNLYKGIYLVKVYTPSGVATKKLVIN